jgi:hypothetical protein
MASYTPLGGTSTKLSVACSPLLFHRKFSYADGKSPQKQGLLARPEGLEPPAYWFEASRSIQLSYGRITHRIILESSRSAFVNHYGGNRN